MKMVEYYTYRIEQIDELKPYNFFWTENKKGKRIFFFRFCVMMNMHPSKSSIEITNVIRTYARDVCVCVLIKNPFFSSFFLKK